MMGKSTIKPRKSAAKTAGNVVQMEPPDASEAAAEVPDTPESPPDAADSSRKSLKVSTQPFPTPPKPKFKGGYCTEEEGMAYWRSLPEELLNRTNVYVNREGPHLNHLQEYSAQEIADMRAKKRRYPAKYIDCPVRPFSEDTRQEFLNRYGSGTWKVFVNDAGVRGSDDPNLQSRNLCKFWVKYWDSDFPPVLDPSRPDKGLGILDLLHPENQGYVADLRRQGILPPVSRAGEDNDVATSQVVEKLTDKVESLASLVAEGKQEQLFQRLSEQMRQNGGNNSEMMQLIIALLARNGGNNGGDSSAAMLTAITTMFQSQLTAMQTQLQSEREERRRYEIDALERAKQPAPDPFVQFEKVMSMIDKARELVAGGSSVASAVKAVRESGYTVLKDIANSPFGASLGNGLGSLLTSLASTGGASGNGNAGSQSQALHPIPPNAQQPGGPTHETDEQKILRIANTITRSMIDQFFDPGESGDLFAERVFDMWPDDFRFLKKLGADTIVNLYRQYNQPLWNHITQNPERGNREADFRKFVADFCAFDPDSNDEKPTSAPGDGFEEGAEA